MKIYFASENKNKYEELSKILTPYRLIFPQDEGIKLNVNESGKDYFSNALLKAEYLFSIVKKPVIADDSGLSIDYFDGAPGIYSSRFGNTSDKKLNQNEKNLLIIEKMKGVSNRSCRFVCNMILYFSQDRFFSIQETLEGVILEKPQGSGGFGYDPIVYLSKFNKSVAELSEDVKNSCSHRGKAGLLIKNLLKSTI